MLPDDILYLSVHELGAQILARNISPVALTESYLARLEKLGPKLGAVATLTPDLALQQARAAEKEIAAGHSRGPLHGIPYGAKDLLATRGIPTTWGAPPFKDQIFNYDATVIRKLREAGAILVAKLAMIELAGGGDYNNGNASLQGPSRCPFNPEHWAGGSSSGPGAAVPAALVGFALGSETLGSIITPSAFSGVSGLRPTYGRVSRHGAMALSWTMDKLGPMCRSAVDCGLVINAIAGNDPLDATSRQEMFSWWPPTDTPHAKSLAGKRLGVVRPSFDAPGFGADPEVRHAFDAALDVLKTLGAKLSNIELPDFPYSAVAVTLYTAEAASIFRPFIESGKVNELIDDTQKAGLIAALSLRATDYLDAMRIRAEILPAVGGLFQKYDALVSPSRNAPAPRLDVDFDAAPPPKSGEEKPATPPAGSFDKWNMIAMSNIAGLPAISVPCGFTKEKNLPIGIQFVADALREEVCIEFAHAYQWATDWHRRRPTLS
ncbi:MAG TPA: amidase [Candidatus Dormibacteraeota bacterium]|nr:amidase [Candidatus Dormibacteraeota bacterium]